MHFFFLFSPQMFVTSVNNLKELRAQRKFTISTGFCRPHFKPIGKRVSCAVADEKKSVNIREKNEVADLYDCCVSSQLSRDETF